MGVPLLTTIIKKYAPDKIKQMSIKDYKDKIFAIDANLLIYKNVFAIRKNGYDIKNDDIIVTHIHSMLLKLIGLKKYNIFCIFVFDGWMPDIKQKTMKARKNLRKVFKKKYNEAKTQDEKKKFFYLKADITKKEIEDCKKLIKIFGFPIYQSEGEADKDLAAISKTCSDVYVVSEDMDILAFGGKKLVKKFSVSASKKLLEIDLDDLLSKLEFNQEMLIKLVILLGCDYCNKIEKIGPISAYKLVKNKKNVTIDEQVKKYYMSAEPNESHNLSNFNEYNIDIKQLIKFLKKNKYKKNFIDKTIGKIYNFKILLKN